MDQNSEYYRQNALSFFESTVAVDMSTLHEAFLSKLPPRAHILDAGCGSGRDAKAFSELGHVVSAFDASADLAKLAGEHCGFKVSVRTFADVAEVDAYDGIWCCASLLHVPAADMAPAIAGLWRALRPRGCIYLSLKLGAGERSHAGRQFTDADDATLTSKARLKSIDTTITGSMSTPSTGRARTRRRPRASGGRRSSSTKRRALPSTCSFATTS